MGASVVLHKNSANAEKWEMLKQTNPVLRSLGSLHHVYQESDNAVVSSLCSVTSTVVLWFDENETAQVTRQLWLMDPMFDLETFMQELQEYIMPELVDSYLSADCQALQMWCREVVRLCLLVQKRAEPALDIQCAMDMYIQAVALVDWSGSPVDWSGSQGSSALEA